MFVTALLLQGAETQNYCLYPSSEELQTSASVLCSLVSKPIGQGPVVLYNRGHGTETLAANEASGCE